MHKICPYKRTPIVMTEAAMEKTYEVIFAIGLTMKDCSM